jgi:hypothetical protein
VAGFFAHKIRRITNAIPTKKSRNSAILEFAQSTFAASSNKSFDETFPKVSGFGQRPRS